MNTAIDKLLDVGQAKFDQLFAGTQQQFEAIVWNIGHLQHRLTDSENLRIYFTHYGSRDTPLPTAYAAVIKCWLVLEEVSAKSMQDYLAATRMWWQVLQTRHSNAAEDFRWESINEEDLRQAEVWMTGRFVPSSVYRQMGFLLRLAAFLEARQICRPLFYQIQTPCPSKTVCTVAVQEARRKKLPSQTALQGLADLFDHLAQTPQDRLRIAAVAILVVTGFRVGELLALPFDCEVEDDTRENETYGLRYLKEKAKSASSLYDIRWLTPLQASLARKAIAEIRTLTAEARAQAKALETHDPHIPIPGFKAEDRMTPKDIQHFLGMVRREQVHNSIARDRLPRYGRDKAYYYLAAEFETYLQSRRVQYLWTVDKGNGTYQMLSESLFIIFHNFFFPRGGHVLLLVEPMRKGQIHSFLSSGGLNKSVFERFEIREKDGSYCRLSSHQFRHWLNDLADKGGLPTDLLTRWMGRDNPQDTQLYKHATMDERLDWVKAGIETGQLQGTTSNIYFDIPEFEREAFLEGQLQAVHFTPMGVCLHDFAIEPCPYHLNCVRGCPDYLRTKGDQQERQHLIQLYTHTEQALSCAQQQLAQTETKLASAWVTHHQETLNGIRQALAVDDEPSPDQGQLVYPTQPNPNGELNGT